MRATHLLLLILINAAWGLNYIAGKIGTADFGPLLFSTVRFVVVLLLLFPFLRIVPGQMRLIILIGFCLGAGHYAAMFYALHIAGSVSSIAVAAQLTIPFTTILAIIFLGERIRLVRSAAIVIAFVGVVIISLDPDALGHPLALAMVSAASLSMAVAAVLMRRLVGVGVFNLQAWIALVSTFSLSILTLWIEQPSIEDIKSIALFDYWSPIYSAIGATIFGHGGLYFLLQRYPINHVAPVISLSTVFAIIFGILIFNDQITWNIIVGGLLTLVGVTTIAIRNAPRETPSSIRVPR